jgi:hypothetical protein
MADTKKSIGKIYANLDPRVRLGVQLIGFGLGAYIIYRLVKGTSQKLEDKPFDSENQQTTNELQVLNQNPSTKQKITNSQAMAYANKIYTCMEGQGTYEYELIGVFYHLNNDADFLAVEKAFGTRTIHSRTYFVPDFRGTMVSAIADELDVSYIKKINDILIQKKIKRRV